MIKRRTYRVPKRMDASELIEKQEFYRSKTIEEVGRLLGEGMERKLIAEEVGISLVESNEIINRYHTERKYKSFGYRKFF